MNNKWLILILITNSMKSIVSIYSLKNMDYPEFLAYHCLESYGQLNTFIPNDAICFPTFISFHPCIVAELQEIIA